MSMGGLQMTKKEYRKALSSYPEALTASEVAEILRVCTKTVYKLIRACLKNSKG